MINHYQDPIFGSQYYKVDIEPISFIPENHNFKVEKWKDLISQQKVPFKRRAPKSNSRNEQDH
jgi:hypothetical protein